METTIQFVLYKSTEYHTQCVEHVMFLRKPLQTQIFEWGWSMYTVFCLNHKKIVTIVGVGFGKDSLLLKLAI